MWREKGLVILLLVILLFLAIGVAGGGVWAEKLDDLQKQVNELQQKVNEAQSQERTLSSQITIINNQIAITKLRIRSTEEELERLSDRISSVSGKISNLEDSLTRVTDVLLNRIERTYIAGRADPLLFLISSADFADFWQRLEYLRQAQRHDRELMLQMAAVQKNYRDQRDLLEERKKQREALSVQLKGYQTKLAAQNREKQALLEVTKNDEKRFQELLAQARRELEELRTSQFTGKRAVGKGEVIGIMGSTGYSFGDHLHFGVYNLREDQAESFEYAAGAQNPLDYLRGRNLGMDSGACSDRGDGGSFGSGSWDWPMSNPKISQCYGRTPVSPFLYAGGVHYGLDMYDQGDWAVRAVESGTAYFYRGSTVLGNNVRVFHSDGKMTLYLHLQ